jgi:formylglycine-generating enzyme required for sulfatase activity
MTGLKHRAYPLGITRDDLLKWYRANRERSKELFALIKDEAYYDRPIALRNPIVFYEGHFPGFSVNTLVKLALERPGVDARLEELFARGIDPEDEAKVKSPTDVWPAREAVQRFAAECDALVEEVIAHAPLVDDDVPELRGGEAVFTILEHEQMHHETLLYMLNNLAYEKKNGVAPKPTPQPTTHKQHAVTIPRGIATLGQPRGSAFGWDNEFPQHVVDVDAFTIDAHNITNGEYLEYVDATHANAPHFWIRGEREWSWRGLLAPAPLQLDAPVYVTYEEATAYARWKGMRLPTEGEFHRAAYGTPDGNEQDHPWGNDLADASRGNFDFASYDPVAIGSYPPSAFGVYDLVGNGWEWTSTPFAGFDGFEPMPSYRVYSAEFFDNAHYVMKGASPITARELVRRSFRNWFRPNYPYVYATFRCVR